MWERRVFAEEQPAEVAYRTGSDGPGMLLEPVFINALGAYTFARRDAARAAAFVRDTWRSARAMGTVFAEWVAGLAEAHVLFESGQDAEAQRALAIAMRLGREQGYVNSQIWVPRLMARLCARALDAGIEVDYVRDLVRRRQLVCDPPPVDIEAWPWAIRISVLGRFAVNVDGRPLAWTGKVPRKPLALLKMLAVQGPAGVREPLLMDRLWSDADGDAARRALATALFRLRRLLGRDAAVLRTNGEIALNPALCWVDLWAVERLLDRAGANGQQPHTDDTLRWRARASALCRGPVVSADEGEGTAAARDRRLRRLLRQAQIEPPGGGMEDPRPR